MLKEQLMLCVSSNCLKNSIILKEQLMLCVSSNCLKEEYHAN